MPSTEESTPSAKPRVAFILEQTLGHITHGANLRSNLAGSTAIDVAFFDIEPDAYPVLRRIPLLSNWTVRAGLQARRAVSALQRRSPADALFVHTQVPAILLGRKMVRTPTIVSLDATPLQYDSLGEFYAHGVGPARIERWKKRANEPGASAAPGTSSPGRRGRDGLVDGYGVPEAKISVISPGVNIGIWGRPTAQRPDAPVKILFVGGDLHRKGGDLLIEAFRRMASDPDLPAAELHLVTRSAVADHPGIVVHRLESNAPALIALYHEAHIFCLPTLGDCLPMVLSEAAAASMAIISTDVGAIGEIVRDGQTGLLIPPGDLAALETALRRLVGDPVLRNRFGAAARELAGRSYDAVANAEAITTLLTGMVAAEVPERA